MLSEQKSPPSSSEGFFCEPEGSSLRGGKKLWPSEWPGIENATYFFFLVAAFFLAGAFFLALAAIETSL
jgi:hypothetical protein